MFRGGIQSGKDDLRVFRFFWFSVRPILVIVRLIALYLSGEVGEWVNFCLARGIAASI